MIKPWIVAHRKRCRAVVMERANGHCESCRARRSLEWDHVAGRRNIVSEPWASSPYLTMALCRGCHRMATDERNGVREFTRAFCADALVQLAKVQGVEYVTLDFDAEWRALDKIRRLVSVLRYPCE